MIKIIVLLMALIAPLTGTLLYAVVTGNETAPVIIRMRDVVGPYIWVGVVYIGVVTWLLSHSIQSYQIAQERKWRA